MRVLLINAVYGRGSTGTIVRDIETLCKENNIECYIASPDKKVREAKHGYVIGNIIDQKLHALFCRLNGKQAYYSHLPTWYLCRYISQIKPDIVHLHNLHSNYINLNKLLYFLAKNDIRTIITLHDCWFYTGGCFHYTAVGCKKWKASCGHCPKKCQDTPAYLFDSSSKILKDRKKYLLSIPHLYVTGVSRWVAHEALQSFLRNTPNYIIPNGIDMDIFKPTPSTIKRQLGLDGKYIILGPASKWLLKANEGVLNAFSNYLKPDEILLLYGSVDSKVNMPSNVRLYGYTHDRNELAQLYTMSDVFVNVTREDSLSLINLEAQACCTPVVTFNQTGPKETVNETDSFSVPVDDANSLYEKVCFIRSQHRESFEKCRLFVQDFFEQHTNYYKYIELYQLFLNEN